MQLRNFMIRGPRPASSLPLPTRAIAAAPSPNKLLTTPVRSVSSSRYPAEQISTHNMMANLPGFATAQLDTALSAFRPPLQPIPTTSSRTQSAMRLSSRHKKALIPGLKNPVVVTQHNEKTSEMRALALSRHARIAWAPSSVAHSRCFLSNSPCVSLGVVPSSSSAGNVK